MTELDDRLAEIYRQYIDPGEYGYEVATCDLEWLIDTVKRTLLERDDALTDVKKLRDILGQLRHRNDVLHAVVYHAAMQPCAGNNPSEVCQCLACSAERALKENGR